MKMGSVRMPCGRDRQLRIFADGGGGLFILNHFTPFSGPALSLALPGLEGNSLRVSVQGVPGLRIEVQRSADLLNWQSWTNGVLGSTSLEFCDPDPNLRRFYRAMAP
jgi:hypothetical protein